MSNIAYDYSTMCVFGVRQQLAGISPFAPVYDMHAATLNTRYSIAAGVDPTAPPVFRYFGIGIQGYYNTDTAAGSQPFKPKSSGAKLHTPIPFRMVPVDEDLSDLERAKYRMRQLYTVGGVQYWTYWLKCLEFPDDRILMRRITPEGEVITFSPSQTDIDNEPSAANLLQDSTTTDRIIASFNTLCLVEPAEVAEVINVLYGGEMNYAKLSEVGLFLGNDEPLTVSDGLGGNIEITEAIYALMGYHRCFNAFDMSIGIPFRATITLQDGNIILKS